MPSNSRTIGTKKTGNDSYRLVQFSDKFVIYKDSKAHGEEAEFSEKIGEFTDEGKAKMFFEKL